MATLYHADGSFEKLLPLGKRFTLGELQKAVGGIIQLGKTYDNRRMVFDEEGKVKGKPFNKLATAMYQYGNHPGFSLVGDVLVFDKGDRM